MIKSKPTVGLLGLSGNPTHKGHIAALRVAAALVGLDRLKLMINPYNPLKDPSEYASYEHREQLARFEVADSPDMHDFLEVCDFEKQLRDRGVPNDTITTLREYERVFPDVEPVWIMGADSLATIHTWGGNWNHILEQYVVVVLAREGDNHAPLHSVAARAYRENRVDPKELLRVGRGYWAFVDSVEHSASSREIRKQVLAGAHPEHISEASREWILQNGLYLPRDEAIAS